MIGEMQAQVLSPADLDEVYAFASARLAQEVADETERTFRSWNVRWRKEALEHYLRLGWSFIARVDGKAVGFYLGQPLLFFRGQTQTLWVEHLDATTPDLARALAEVAVKVAREKHFQRVLFGETSEEVLAGWNPQPLADGIFEIATTKGAAK